MELDRTERRLIGALLEKRWTTPDQYPLTLNALVAACNQKSNRDPVMSVTDFEVDGCLRGLRTRGLVMVHERDGGRVQRFAERVENESNLSRPELAILAELMLRGPQAHGELYRRCKRMSHFANEGEVMGLLRELARGHWVRVLPKRPRERYQRWEHLLAPDGESAADTPIEEDAPLQPGTPVEQDPGFDEPTTRFDPNSPPMPPSEAMTVSGIYDAVGSDGEPEGASDAAAVITALTERLAELEERVAELERLATEPE